LVLCLPSWALRPASGDDTDRVGGVRGRRRSGAKDKGPRTRDESAALAIPIADALHEALLLVGQGGAAEFVQLVQQFVQAALVGDALLGRALELAGGPALEPAAPPADPAHRRGRLNRVALQAGVALREVVAEQPLLSPCLHQHPLAVAGVGDED